MSGNESFWDRNIIDGGKWAGDKEMNPKPTQDRVESDNTWRRGHGVHNVPNSFDLHCRKVSWQRARWQDGSCTLRVIAGSWLGQVERTSNTETLEKWWSTCLEASEKNVRGCSHGTAMMIPKRAFLSRSSHSAFQSKWNSRSGRKFHSGIVKT